MTTPTSGVSSGDSWSDIPRRGWWPRPPGGLEAIRQAKPELPATKFIVITIHLEAPYREAATRSGADAFVPKKAVGTDLVPTIERLVSGS
jgi:DNA-binding NarL/FixJ family response regulator